MTVLQHINGHIQQAQGPPIKYDTVGKVALSINTNVGIKHIVLSRVVLICDGNFNLFSPRAAAKTCGGDVKRDKQGRDCIVIGKDQQQRQLDCATIHNGRVYLDVVSKDASSNNAAPKESIAKVKKKETRVLQAKSDINAVMLWCTWHS